MFRIQNQLGVNALFTWGVVPENKTNYIAIVPGGWVEELLMVGYFFIVQNAFSKFTFAHI